MIEISDNWAIDADNYNIILMHRHASEKNPDKMLWSIEGYYFSLRSALNALPSYELKRMKNPTLASLTDRLDRIEAMLKTMPDININDLRRPKKVLSPEHLAKIKESRKHKRLTNVK